MRILLDTNILINWLVETNLKHKDSSQIVKMCLKGTIEGFVTSHSLTDAFYVLRKYHHSIEDRKRFILIMVYNFTILTEDAQKFLEVLDDELFFDLEDGLQMKCAEYAHLDYIVTDNLKDFTTSTIPVLSIEEALLKL